MPGKSEVLGPISQFWELDKYHANPDALRRRLFLANRDEKGDHGLFKDDVTIIAGRRRI